MATGAERLFRGYERALEGKATNPLEVTGALLNTMGVETGPDLLFSSLVKAPANTLAINRAQVFENLVANAPEVFKKLSPENQQGLMNAIKMAPKAVLDPIKNIKWKLDPEEPGSLGTYWDGASREIHLNPNYEEVLAGKAWVGKSGSEKGILNTFFHELTHAAQDLGGEIPELSSEKGLADAILQAGLSELAPYGHRPIETHARALGEIFANRAKADPKIAAEVPMDEYTRLFKKYQERSLQLYGKKPRVEGLDDESVARQSRYAQQRMFDLTDEIATQQIPIPQRAKTHGLLALTRRLRRRE
jgi:hypothetical protein